MIIDFEGEPARPLAEQFAKPTPLKDLVGMLRSFGYAADMPTSAPFAASPEQMSGKRRRRACGRESCRRLLEALPRGWPPRRSCRAATKAFNISYTSSSWTKCSTSCAMIWRAVPSGWVPLWRASCNSSVPGHPAHDAPQSRNLEALARRLLQRRRRRVSGVGTN